MTGEQALEAIKREFNLSMLNQTNDMVKKLSTSQELQGMTIKAVSAQLTYICNLIDGLSDRISALESNRLPVGSVYVSIDAENPSAKFGGEWVELDSTGFLTNVSCHVWKRTA